MGMVEIKGGGKGFFFRGMGTAILPPFIMSPFRLQIAKQFNP